MKVGINQWMFPDNMSLRDCFRLAKDAGADGIEVNIYPDKGEINLETPISMVEEVAEFVKALGLEVASVLPAQVFPNLAKIERGSEEMQVALERAVKLMDITKALGTDTILLVPGGIGDGSPRYDVAYRNASYSVGELARVAADKGVYLAVENVWNKFLLSPLEMCQFIDQFESDYIKAYFDIGNILLYGFPEHWIEILAGRIKRVHIKDFNRAAGNFAGFVPLLAGDVDWKKVIDALRAVGYDGFIISEVSRTRFYPEFWIEETVRTIRRIIAG